MILPRCQCTNRLSDLLMEALTFLPAASYVIVRLTRCHVPYHKTVCGQRYFLKHISSFSLPCRMRISVSFSGSIFRWKSEVQLLTHLQQCMNWHNSVVLVGASILWIASMFQKSSCYTLPATHYPLLSIIISHQLTVLSIRNIFVPTTISCIICISWRVC